MHFKRYNSNSITSEKKSSKDGANITPHSGTNVSKVIQSSGKKRFPLTDIEMNTDGLCIALEVKEEVEITESLPGHSPLDK